jgi:hypothetical protein
MGYSELQAGPETTPGPDNLCHHRVGRFLDKPQFMAEPRIAESLNR